MLNVVALLVATADVAEPDTRASLSGSIAGYYYLVPSSADSVVAIGTVDAGRTHLEARYGYEAFKSGSLFVGHRFDVFGDGPLAVAITPIAGGVFGALRGVAPGLELDAKWRRLELSSESEYVFDVSPGGAGFVYSWSELVIRPVERCAFGAVVQRTRIFRGGLAVDPGGVAGCTVAAFTAKVYSFDPLSAERFAFALAADL